jgi:hypothetical protein
MVFKEKTINCNELEGYKNSNRIKPFNLTYTTFNYQSSLKDKEFIDKIIVKGEELAKKVNPGAANNSNKSRKKERLINNASAGLLAEYCWKQYINKKANSNIVDYTEFTDAATQIDLYTIANNKLIEVRSSFPRNGIQFSICHATYEFDILGPYSNTVKPGEIQKDFYVRTLFHITAGKSFLELIKEDRFNVFLTGGATWNMMNDSTISKNKDLVPEDSFLPDEEKSTFRVVPFSKSLDTVEIFNLINSTNS